MKLIIHNYLMNKLKECNVLSEYLFTSKKITKLLKS